MAAVLAAAVGVIGLIGATGSGAPVVVVAAVAITVAGFEAKARWLRLPSSALMVWTGGPAIFVNLLVWSEGLFFLVVVAVFLVVLTEPDRRIRPAVGAAGVLSPVLVDAATHQHGFGWPFWGDQGWVMRND